VSSEITIPDRVLFGWRRWLGVRDTDETPDVDLAIRLEYERYRATGLTMNVDSIKQMLRMLEPTR
jgi:hypothetical protein